ncbi:MAG: hypothetical protein K2L03_05555 [Bacteroidales bacterium]|nr:hypothetical protein [Bacteroidales bacterium]MDE6515487.1 hypothetical protein [Bacteroidales bacterium]
MNIKKFIGVLLTGLGICLTFAACNQSKNLGGYYTYQTECLGSELDGSYTLRAWGIGRNQVDALAQARKNALRDVIFKGISKGKSDCEIKPILMEVNAEEKYRDYFNRFFADGGEFEHYVNYKDKRVSTFHRERTEDEIKYGVTVRVLYDRLVDKLRADGILK